MGIKAKQNKQFTVEETTQLEGTSQETKSTWEGSEVEVQSDKLDDGGGSGQRVMLRFFNFKYPPGKHKIPTKAQVLTKEYVDSVKTILYFEHDLEIEGEPRVVFQKDGFRVIFPCIPRRGRMALDRYGMQTTTLNDMAHGQ